MSSSKNANGLAVSLPIFAVVATEKSATSTVLDGEAGVRVYPMRQSPGAHKSLWARISQNIAAPSFQLRPITTQSPQSLVGLLNASMSYPLHAQPLPAIYGTPLTAPTTANTYSFTPVTMQESDLFGLPSDRSTRRPERSAHLLLAFVSTYLGRGPPESG